MDIDLDKGKLLIFLGGLLFFIILEAIFPKRTLSMSWTSRIYFHLSVAFLNTIIVRVLIYVPFLYWIVYVESQGWGISRLIGLSGWVEILCSFVVLDLFDYFWHRFNHRVKFLWRFHKAHHADPEMDASTSLRFHPGELFISSLTKAVWLFIWGPTAISWFIFEVMVSLCSQFHHSNIDFSDKIEDGFLWILVTPRLHASHHAVDRKYGDANFSTIFSIWDRIFGSFQKPLDGGLATIGEDDIGLPQDRNLSFNLLEWILEPGMNRNLYLANLDRNPDV